MKPIFNIRFWKYLLRKADDPTYTSKWRRFWCRWNFHPNGTWYYNPCGYEPNYTCKDCGDQIL